MTFSGWSAEESIKLLRDTLYSFESKIGFLILLYFLFPGVDVSKDFTVDGINGFGGGKKKKKKRRHRYVRKLTTRRVAA